MSTPATRGDLRQIITGLQRLISDDPAHDIAEMTLMLQGLPASDGHQIMACYAELRRLVETHGEHGLLALALLGAELQAEGQ
jgi:hypothetical protein